MGVALRALLVEDVEADALLLVRELKRGGFDVAWDRVETAEAMSAALAKQTWDVVISDHAMPRFSAPLALALLKEQNRDIPFIIVSGTVSEEIAVAALHAGAQDFMAKGKLARLVPAIERELRDVSLRAERARMQEQLLVSDRMASVGTLAAGVAHEINNPLAALMANLDFAAEDAGKLAGSLPAGGDPAVEARLREILEPLRDARECADRIRLIVRDLKMLSRSDETRRGAVDIRRVIESSLRMASNEIRHRARLVKDYGEIPDVDGNEGRLGQVFLNLIMNAAQAIPEGRADKNEIRVVTRLDDRGRVVAEIRDSGSGIPAAVRLKIFDPFFTTKAIGLGTGLGLAICHRIVTALGGEIQVESEVGKGSLFRIILPPASGTAVDAPPVTASLTPPRRARIMVVDDEAALGSAVRRMLASEHDVVPIQKARTAIDRLLSEHFDVVLCDLMMPEMTGMDLYAEVLARAPEQAEKLVFMTGGAFTSRAREFLDTTRNARIDKPFDVGDLRAVIHALLRP